MLRLGGGKLAAIGQQRSAQPGDPALPCCLARFVDAAPPWRPAHDQENRKIRLAEEPPFAAPPRPPSPSSHTEVQSTPARCLLACLARPFLVESWEFWIVVTVWFAVLCCSRCSAAMTLTCSMQACIRITSVHITYVKGSHNTLLIPKKDCKSYASV
jgi:hypothetical protein